MVAEGIKLMSLGMGVVFIFLLLIFAVVSIFSIFLKPYSYAEIAAGHPSRQDEGRKRGSLLSPKAGAGDTQLIAVISAAVSKYRGSN